MTSYQPTMPSAASPDAVGSRQTLGFGLPVSPMKNFISGRPSFDVRTPPIAKIFRFGGSWAPATRSSASRAYFMAYSYPGPGGKQRVVGYAVADDSNSPDPASPGPGSRGKDETGDRALPGG